MVVFKPHIINIGHDLPAFNFVSMLFCTRSSTYILIKPLTGASHKSALRHRVQLYAGGERKGGEGNS